jgi:hypothetical protein
MKFIAFGDSFTSGFAAGLTHEQSKQISFVNQLQYYTNFTGFENFAVPGSSNNQIAYTVYNWAKSQNTNDCFVFIGWTTFIRNSTWIDDEYKRIGNTNRFNFFRKTKLEKFYLPDSIKRQIFDTERDILATVKLLELLKIPCCMMQSFDDHTLIRECAVNKNISFPNCINWSEKNNTMIDICCERYLSNTDHQDYGKNHKQFNLVNKYLTPCKHPNEQGHKLIAQTIYPFLILENIVTKNI